MYASIHMRGDSVNLDRVKANVDVRGDEPKATVDVHTSNLYLSLNADEALTLGEKLVAEATKAKAALDRAQAVYDALAEAAA